MSDSPSPPHPFSPRAVGVLAAVTTILIWVSFIVIARASASHTLLPMDIVWVRYFGAGLALLPWSWWASRNRRASGPAAGSLGGLSPLPLDITVIAGLLGGLGYAGFAYSGFFFAPAAHASILLPGSLPLWTALLAVIVLGDRLAPGRIIGLALILLGCLLGGATSLLATTTTGPSWIGDLMFATAAMCWASYGLMLRQRSLDPVAATTALTAFTCVAFLPAYGVAIFVGIIPSRLAQAPWPEILFQTLVQGVGSVVISGISFGMMVRHFGPVRSTMITAVVPGLSALAAAVFLGEPLHPTLLLGLGLVTFGILVGVQRARPSAVQDHASVR